MGVQKSNLKKSREPLPFSFFSFLPIVPNPTPAPPFFFSFLNVHVFTQTISVMESRACPFAPLQITDSIDTMFVKKVNFDLFSLNRYSVQLVS